MSVPAAGTLSRRMRKLVVLRNAGSPRAPGAALPVRSGFEQILRRDVASVDEDYELARQVTAGRIALCLHSDVELLAGRDHPAVGRHDPDVSGRTGGHDPNPQQQGHSDRQNQPRQARKPCHDRMIVPGAGFVIGARF
jgi:hypothetical protein